MIICLWIAAICNGMMDSIAHHDVMKGNKFWGLDAWRNKYKNRDPLQGPKFWGSTTILVCTTDGWHLLKEGMITAICWGIATVLMDVSTMPFVVSWLILRLVYYVGFSISYFK